MRRPGKGESERSNQVIEIARAVNDTVYLNGPSSNDVEREVGLNHKNTITVLSEFGMSWDSPKERVMLKLSNGSSSRSMKVTALLGLSFAMNSRIDVRSS